ncbi:phenylpyruvate tautomerase MIF-related protein [uncultured Ruminococcus sp.]|uniref:phenylpyruvate tautomerase MIF-related protein n=1 Tax=Ruminococcus sp. TaxID=41978 RepID=UPI00265D0C34|nr:phenylpyruvate tautomerase MIF-related protein [uncultured Ruminococcus sp.]
MIYERTDFMPFIDVKTNVTFSKEKADELMKELSGSLKAIGKSEAYVMCAVNDGLKMSFQGISDEPAAIVEVKLLGKGTKDGYAKVTENICNIMQTNGIAGKRCYVKYDEVEHWGMDSFMF